jgi:uncharacterized membrane protein YdjX (TVP38/TMEM64 family)
VRWLRIGALLVIVAVVVIAHLLGVFHDLGDPARAARTLRDLGVWGYVAFVGSYALLQPFGLPGTAFVVAASLIWPWPVAFALSMTGTMAASVVGYSFARLVARDWVARRIPVRFRRFDEALARRGLATVFLLRLVFWMPPLLHAFFGVSRVGFWTHFWGSFAGYLVPLFLLCFFGQRVLDALSDLPAGAWIGAGVAVAIALAVGIWIWRRRVRAVR